MKKNLLLLISMLLISSISSAQIIITEIMYNPPESGTDSLEYIEIYNSSDIMVNLQDYQFTQGVNHTFGNVGIVSESYLVISKNASAMMSVLGVESIQWDDGALSNGGEYIELKDANGVVVDYVDYDDEAPWPGEDDGTDSQGGSIELCDLDSDNGLGSNWGVSQTATGVILNDKEILATPGAANTATCALTGDYTVIASGLVFVPADLTINVGETVLWENESGSHNVNGSLAKFPNNPEGFHSGNVAPAPWFFAHTFTIPGVYDYQCDPHVSLGMVGTITVLETANPDFPLYDIATVTTEDAAGVVDSLDVNCSLEGTLYGVNLRPGGLQFTIIDDSGNGIGCFSGSNQFGYSVTEGDKIHVQGQIGHYNGFVQIGLDTVILMSQGNTLLDPTVVTALDESTESRLVKLQNVSLVDPSDWQSPGNSFNIDVTDGTNIYTLRIDNDVVVDEPFGVFHVTGLGGQYDSQSPYDEGYQLLPRYTQDLEGDTPPPPNFPLYDIGTVTTIDANGVVDSAGVDCSLEGILYGVNFRPSGLQFTVIDASGDGIGCFSGSNNFGYTVAEGDMIRIMGKIGQFNGLTQMSLDSVMLLSQGNTLLDPTIVTALGEETESLLIKVENVSMVDPEDWQDSGSFNVDVTDGTNTYTMRIDGDVTVDEPTGVFHLTGIGGQYDSNGEPFDEGYQILPRYTEDIEIVDGVKQLNADSYITLSPNPTTGTINIESEISFESYVVYNIMGSKILKQAYQKSIDVSQLESGLYLIQFVVDNKYYNSKFLKE